MKPELLSSIIELADKEKAKGFHFFKNEADELMSRFPELEITYEDTTIDPWASCAIKDCQHFTILDIFEREGVNFWTRTNPLAVQHKYWKRAKGYKRSDGEIEIKIRTYWDLYQRIKMIGWKEKQLEASPIFLCDFRGVHHRHDGHHRTAIAKFLEIRLPVKIAKFTLVKK